MSCLSLALVVILSFMSLVCGIVVFTNAITEGRLVDAVGGMCLMAATFAPIIIGILHAELSRKHAL